MSILYHILHLEPWFLMSEAGVIRFLSQILAFSQTQDLENLLEPEMRKKYWGYVMGTAMMMELASPSISLIVTGQGKTYSKYIGSCLVDTYYQSWLWSISTINLTIAVSTLFSIYTALEYYISIPTYAHLCCRKILSTGKLMSLY